MGCCSYERFLYATMQKRNSVVFEYTGNTALSVTGKITGTHYRFSAPGERQNIDGRDAAGMMGIPVLQKVA